MKKKADREKLCFRVLMRGLGKGALLGSIVAWLFYRSFLGMVLLPFFLVVSVRKEQKQQKHRTQERQHRQFAEWLGFLKEALQVGYSLEQAIIEARKSLLTTYDEKDSFLQAIAGMQRKMRLGISVEQAFFELAGECQCEEIEDFSEVLYIAKRTGGAVNRVIADTERIIHEKQETMRHINSVLQSRSYETRIMKYMPFAMLAYLQLFMPGFLAPLYGNATGICIMSVSLLIYGGLSFLIDRIGTISV